MIRRKNARLGAMRDSSGRLVLLAPRRFRMIIALGFAGAVGTAGFLIGQHALQHASAAIPAGSPYGAVNSIASVPGGVHVIGFAVDPSAPLTPINTSVYSDNTLVATGMANLDRPDVATQFPGAGPTHGYDITARVPEGTHNICVRGVNIGAGADRLFSCYTMTFRYKPYGAVDQLSTAPGHVIVRGWTLDWDSPSTALNAVVTVDGSPVATLAANLSRPDIPNPYLAAGGPLHGFWGNLPLPQGTHTVCVIGKNILYGEDTTILCKSLTLSDSPVVYVDSAHQDSGGYYVRGWAFDPNAPTTPLTVTTVIDGKIVGSFVANLTRPDVAAAYPAAGAAHGFTAKYFVAQGSHTICMSAVNISYGYNRHLICGTITVNFNPSAAITGLSATRLGALVSGWTIDPDTTSPIHVRIYADGALQMDFSADATGPTQSGHRFSAYLVLKSGTHTICAIGVNALYGTANSPSVCQTITLGIIPLGVFEGLSRAPNSSSLVVTGWTLDADAPNNGPITAAISVDGVVHNSVANVVRNDLLSSAYRYWGAAHGFGPTIPASDGEHRVCVTGLNVGGGATNTALGCKIINAVHPVVPSAPRTVTAVAGFGGATVTWAAPSTDGGAPWSTYIVTASPGGATLTLGPTATSASLTGLAAKTAYHFIVQAVNIVGASTGGISPTVTTLPAPPPQTTPAPISTSRYIRNIVSASSTDLAAMRAEGAADAKANPSGHGYLILLDIGGQDQADGGVVLSATTHFVSYSNLVADLNAYVDGYHGAQASSAPVTIAIGTNNDMDVSSTSGVAWADSVIDPVAAHSAQYLGMTVAGANDIEPGFRGSYTATKSWLLGYLGATKAPFVFNGSADGCSWTATAGGCNNGWIMSGLAYLAGAASPVRIIDLPQVYNNTMAAQWKYISLTGVAQGVPRINFGGVLTEWTACSQAGGCGSLTGHDAWSALWSNLQSSTTLKVASLPYSTDLRIDR
ncbi:MAG TPA: fibronectin type III domain-containing protein [Jatrophihabitantaceae bacterium]|nr:fibronectin type III domain-containing protein [Jatrophihabitantaceae bacterium]